jgi:hypothetical protein
MRVFLSYSNEDKLIAGKIKHSLGDLFGIDVFLAHEDIEPSTEWQEEIIKELKACHVLLPIITSNFYHSPWANQEVGFALARGIPIVPIHAGEIPCGFIARYQALKYDEPEGTNTCKALANIIVKQRQLRSLFLDKVIENFGKSDSFTEAARRTEIVFSFKSMFSKRQKNRIIELASENSQIYACYASQRLLPSFISEYGETLDKDLVKEYYKKSGR